MKELKYSIYIYIYAKFVWLEKEKKLFVFSWVGWTFFVKVVGGVGRWPPCLTLILVPMMFVKDC
jgi:hypothetical protein